MVWEVVGKQQRKTKRNFPDGILEKVLHFRFLQRSWERTYFHENIIAIRPTLWHLKVSAAEGDVRRLEQIWQKHIRRVLIRRVATVSSTVSTATLWRMKTTSVYQVLLQHFQISQKKCPAIAEPINCINRAFVLLPNCVIEFSSLS